MLSEEIDVNRAHMWKGTLDMLFKIQFNFVDLIYNFSIMCTTGLVTH